MVNVVRLTILLPDWTCELAPKSVRKPLAYITGWLLVLGWQADLASAAYLGGIIIQGLASLNYPEYVVERWQVSDTTISHDVYPLTSNRER